MTQEWINTLKAYLVMLEKEKIYITVTMEDDPELRFELDTVLGIDFQDKIKKEIQQELKKIILEENDINQEFLKEI